MDEEMGGFFTPYNGNYRPPTLRRRHVPMRQRIEAAYESFQPIRRAIVSGEGRAGARAFAKVAAKRAAGLAARTLPYVGMAITTAQSAVEARNALRKWRRGGLDDVGPQGVRRLGGSYGSSGPADDTHRRPEREDPPVRHRIGTGPPRRAFHTPVDDRQRAGKRQATDEPVRPVKGVKTAHHRYERKPTVPLYGPRPKPAPRKALFQRATTSSDAMQELPTEVTEAHGGAPPNVDSGAFIPNARRNGSALCRVGRPCRRNNSGVGYPRRYAPTLCVLYRQCRAGSMRTRPDATGRASTRASHART
jgi:hypothetical protein